MAIWGDDPDIGELRADGALAVIPALVAFCGAFSFVHESRQPLLAYQGGGWVTANSSWPGWVEHLDELLLLPPELALALAASSACFLFALGLRLRRRQRLEELRELRGHSEGP